MSSDAEQAVEQLVAGYPGAAARRWLGPFTIVLIALFALNTLVVFVGPVLLVDRPVELFVQRFPFGPYSHLMELTNWVAGYRQPVLGALVVLALLLIERRAGYLMALGYIGSVIGQGLKLVLERNRPSPSLVHILDPSSGFSYPSAHAVFYTWLAFMAAFALAPRVPPPWRVPLWLAAAFVVFTACLGRVWAGDRWPSDVVGGFLLGLGWATFVLWIPERYLPRPTLGRFRAASSSSEPRRRSGTQGR